MKYNRGVQMTLPPMASPAVVQILRYDRRLRSGAVCLAAPARDASIKILAEYCPGRNSPARVVTRPVHPY